MKKIILLIFFCIVLSSSVFADDLYSSLIGQWPVNDSSGTNIANLLNDSLNMTTGGNDGSWTGGLLDYAWKSDGDSYATVDNTTFTTVETISFWYKSTAFGAAQTIFSMADKDQVDTRLQLRHPLDEIEVLLYNDAATRYTITTSGAVSAGNWYHFVLTTNGTHALVYVNGTLEGSTSYTGTLLYDSGLETFTLGCAYYDAGGGMTCAGGSYTDTTYNLVQVFDRNLTAAEVATLYNSGAPNVLEEDVTGLAEGLFAYFGFDSDYNLTDEVTGNYHMNGSVEAIYNDTLFKNGDGSYYFRGSDRLDSPDIYWDDIDNAGNMSLAVWMYPTNVDNEDYQNIFAGTSANDQVIGFSSDVWNDNWQVIISDTGAYPSPSLVDNNNWYLVVFTKNGSTGNLYVNGTNIGPITVGATPSHILLRLGEYYTDSDHFVGNLDELMIWNRTLSDAEVTTLYNGGTGNFYPFGVTPPAPAPSDVNITVRLTSPLNGTESNVYEQNFTYNYSLTTAAAAHCNILNGGLDNKALDGSVIAANGTQALGLGWRDYLGDGTLPVYVNDYAGEDSSGLINYALWSTQVADSNSVQNTTLVTAEGPYIGFFGKLQTNTTGEDWIRFGSNAQWGSGSSNYPTCYGNGKYILAKVGATEYCSVTDRDTEWRYWVYVFNESGSGNTTIYSGSSPNDLTFENTYPETDSTPTSIQTYHHAGVGVLGLLVADLTMWNSTNATACTAANLYGLSEATGAWKEGVTYYKFDNNFTNDLSPPNNSLSVVGTTTIKAANKVVGAAAADFSGNGDARNNSFVGAEDIRTIDFWVYPDVADGDDTFINFNVGTADSQYDMRCWLDGGGNTECFLRSGGAQVWGIDVGNKIKVGSWYHVVLIFNNSETGNVELYVNGTLAGNSANVGYMDVGGSGPYDTFRIGDDVFAAAKFEGQIDNVFFSNESYTSADVTTSYNNHQGIEHDTYTPTTPAVTHCQLWTNETGSWAFEENQSSPSADTSNTIQHNFSVDGIYLWNVGCGNSSNLTFAEENWTLTIDTGVLNVSLTSPPNDSIVSNSNFTLDYHIYGEAVNCSLWFNSTGTFEVNQTDLSPANNSDNSFNMTNIPDGSYFWNVECVASNGTSVFGENRTFEVKVVTFDDIWVIPEDDFPTKIYPPDVIANLTDKAPIFNFTTNYESNCTMSNLSRVVDCNTTNYLDHECYFVDSIGSVGNRTIEFFCNSSGAYAWKNVTVTILNDTFIPSIIILSNNSFSTDNTTILNNQRENVTIGVEFSDVNLFQAMINISCDINDTLFYWEELNFNVSNYTFSQEVSIYNQTPQKCTALFAASDDHTDEEIPDYDYTVNGKDIVYRPAEDVEIRIITDDDDIKKIKTKKKKDRYNFQFNYDERKNHRKYRIVSNKPLYYRESGYPAHFVVWDEDEHKGYWVDLEQYQYRNAEYTVTDNSKSKDKEYAYEYKIDFKSEKKAGENLTDSRPKKKCIFPWCDWMNEKELEEYYYGIDSIKFSSIGGTNIFNVSYEFFIGTDLNISSLNVYDNTSFPQYNISFVRDDGWSRNISLNATTDQVYVALSNGTYDVYFSSDYFYNQSYQINITNVTHELTYESFQAVVNFMVQIIEYNHFINNFSIQLNDTLSTISYTNLTLGNTSTFYVNASTYDYLFFKDENYVNTTGSTSLNYLENKTVIINVPFNFLFIFTDERTLNPFNVSGADSITMFQYCQNETYDVEINASNQTIPLACDFEKIKFVLYYPADVSYYRTLIFDLEGEIDTVSRKVYLIDTLTTSYIYNTFVLDDLFGEYTNPSLYIRKQTEDGLILIHSDFVDIEGKVGAYLIANHEYEMSLESSNNPTLLLGNYAADISGDKRIKIWDINLNATRFIGNRYESSVISVMGSEDLEVGNTTETNAFLMYRDSANITERVNFVVVNNSLNPGNTICNLTINNTLNFDSLCNIDDYVSYPYPIYARTTIFFHDGTTTNMTKKVSEGNQTLSEFKELLNRGYGISQDWLDMFWVIFLGIIALYATFATENVAAYALLGLGGLLVAFGWWDVSKAFFGVLLLLTLIYGYFSKYHETG